MRALTIYAAGHVVQVAALTAVTDQRWRMAQIQRPLRPSAPATQPLLPAELLGCSRARKLRSTICAQPAPSNRNVPHARGEAQEGGGEDLRGEADIVDPSAKSTATAKVVAWAKQG